jgi:hypothetical protein
MSTPLNYLVKAYLRKWDKQLYRIKHDAKNVQLEQLVFISKSKYMAFYHAVNQRLKIARPLEYIEQFSVSNYSHYEKRTIELLENNSLHCRYFARSSGTGLAAHKLIPTPETFVRMNHLRGSWYSLHTLYRHDPKMNVFGMKNLLIGGSIYEQTNQYIIGDVSGIMLFRIPWYMRPSFLPTISTAVLPNWDEKLEQTAEAASRCRDVSLIGGVPTWVLAVVRRALEKSKYSKLSALWPNAKAYIHGGVSFEPYRQQFEEQLNMPGFRFIEIYNATEGFFGFQDRPFEEGVLLMLHSGIYYEFIEREHFQEISQRIIPIWETRLETEYVLLITTYSGLIRYVQGDVIKFVTLAPYRVKVTGRIGEYVNAFGEDLSKEQAEGAILSVAKLFRVKIHQYTLGPQYITMHEKGYHEWFIEFEKMPSDLVLFEKRLDEVLCVFNPNYAQKRSGNIALQRLKINLVPSGGFRDYMRSKGRIGGQHKIQRVRNDRLIVDELTRFFNNSRG